MVLYFDRGWYDYKDSLFIGDMSDKEDYITIYRKKGVKSIRSNHYHVLTYNPVFSNTLTYMVDSEKIVFEVAGIDSRRHIITPGVRYVSKKDKTSYQSPFVSEIKIEPGKYLIDDEESDGGRVVAYFEDRISEEDE